MRSGRQERERLWAMSDGNEAPTPRASLLVRSRCSLFHNLITVYSPPFRANVVAWPERNGAQVATRHNRILKLRHRTRPIEMGPERRGRADSKSRSRVHYMGGSGGHPAPCPATTLAAFRRH